MGNYLPAEVLKEENKQINQALPLSVSPLRDS